MRHLDARPRKLIAGSQVDVLLRPPHALELQGLLESNIVEPLDLIDNPEGLPGLVLDFLSGQLFVVEKPAALTTRNLLIARCDESLSILSNGLFSCQIPAKKRSSNATTTFVSVQHHSRRARIHFRKSHHGRRTISIAQFSPGAASGIES